MPPKAKQPAPASKPTPKGKKPPPAMVNRQAMGTYQGKPISRSSGLYAKVKKEPEQEEVKKPAPKSKQLTPPPLKPVELNKIAPGLKALRVKIAGLIPDPNNARLHPERNLEAIKDSLRLYGQVKPIVVRKQTKVVVAGNGTMEAAKALGWTEIAANFVEMTDLEAAGFGLADNRSAELAKWDFEVVSRLQKLMGESEHAAVGWTVDELTVLRQNMEEYQPIQQEFSSEEWQELWQGMPEFTQEDLGAFRKITVNFKTEDDMKAFFKLTRQNPSETANNSMWFPPIPYTPERDRKYVASQSTTQTTSRKKG